MTYSFLYSKFGFDMHNLKISCKRLKAIVFLLLFPAINTGFGLLILTSTGFIQGISIVEFTLRIWLANTISYIIIVSIEARFRRYFSGPESLQHLLLYLSIIIPITLSLRLEPPFIQELGLRASGIFPATMISLELLVYFALMHILSQRIESSSIAFNLQQSQLNALRAQSNPHFLFNTLNLIVAEITKNPRTAAAVVYDLADLLHSTLNLASRDFCRVADEIRIVERYLQLQQKRFEDRLSYKITCSPECLSETLPTLILQPLVENCVKHVVAPHSQKTAICLIIKKSVSELIINLQDNGPQFDERSILAGNGHRIVRQTLQLHYPNAHSFSLSCNQWGGFYQLKIPCRGVRNDRDSNNRGNQ